MLIVPSDPLRPRRPDPHYAEERAAARDRGADVVVVDHDALQAARDLEQARAAVRHVLPSAAAVYRGWMVSRGQYALLEAALFQRGTSLRTSSPSVPDEVLAELAPALGSLELPFVTADVVRRPDGRWRVVEVGDGQVSGRPRTCSASDLVSALLV